MLGDAFKRVMEREVPWNDLRQAAVLRRLHKAAKWKPRGTSRWPVVLVAASALAVVALVVRAKWVHPSGNAEPAIANRTASGDMLVRLPDGSTARGENSADVKVESLEVERAELVQTAGRVRYDVMPNARRRFVVRAREVQVSVLGTAFYVEMSPAAVVVHVERGNVEVVQRDRRVVLATGEGITLDTTIASAEAASASNAPQPSSTPEVSLRDGPNAAGETPGRRALPHAASNGASAAQMLERADRARARGDLEGAAHALRELIQRYPADARATLAYFTLGRVLGAEGAHRDAAQAFAACLARGPIDSLAEDALAELARAHARAGQRADAVAAAQQYLSSYPKGVHARAMRDLVGGAD
jgi:transmembrane sensor